MLLDLRERVPRREGQAATAPPSASVSCASSGPARVGGGRGEQVGRGRRPSRRARSRGDVRGRGRRSGVNPRTTPRGRPVRPPVKVTRGGRVRASRRSAAATAVGRGRRRRGGRRAPTPARDPAPSSTGDPRAVARGVRREPAGPRAPSPRAWRARAGGRTARRRFGQPPRRGPRPDPVKLLEPAASSSARRSQARQVSRRAASTRQTPSGVVSARCSGVPGAAMPPSVRARDPEPHGPPT